MTGEVGVQLLQSRLVEDLVCASIVRLIRVALRRAGRFIHPTAVVAMTCVLGTERSFRATAVVGFVLVAWCRTRRLVVATTFVTATCPVGTESGLVAAPTVGRVRVALRRARGLVVQTARMAAATPEATEGCGRSAAPTVLIGVARLCAWGLPVVAARTAGAIAHCDGSDGARLGWGCSGGVGRGTGDLAGPGPIAGHGEMILHFLEGVREFGHLRVEESRPRRINGQDVFSQVHIRHGTGRDDRRIGVAHLQPTRLPSEASKLKFSKFLGRRHADEKAC